ncbi:hypothetical protein KQI86_19455 [Clostridium sp. MSJ-11]|uniref:IrrE N-terminal-like domain-containing protein n=1 Tax=Clostridium mobile TaxID=2841512 RepID=A0ABS6EMM5_9CLOT|nr:ImmA/IrrE family metallo-endopeptidase [Clostridium mobile]MBU5486481.1 hypothetical protein [Clostridium mobile]
MLNHINILGINYKIKYLNDLIERENLYGEIDYHKQTIRIDESMRRDRKVRTLIHEILHGIMESLGYNDINCDEEKIQNISNALYLLLENNPKLLSLFSLR